MPIKKFKYWFVFYINMMQGIIQGFKSVFGLGLLYKKFIPILFVGVYLIIKIATSIIQSITQGDFTIFINTIANTIFSVDYNIYTNVMVAVNQPEAYNLWHFIVILESLLILYYLTKWIALFVAGYSPASMNVWCVFVALCIIGIIELATVRFVNGSWFVPFTGIYVLLVNLPVVLVNIDYNILNMFNANATFDASVTGNYTVTNATLDIINTNISSNASLKSGVLPSYII